MVLHLNQYKQLKLKTILIRDLKRTLNTRASVMKLSNIRLFTKYAPIIFVPADLLMSNGR